MIPSKTFVVVKSGAILAPPQSVPSGDRLTLIGVVSPPRTWTSAENFRNPFFVMSTWCIPSARCTSNRSPGADPRQDSPSIVTSAPDGCTRIVSVPNAVASGVPAGGGVGPAYGVRGRRDVPAGGGGTGGATVGGSPVSPGARRSIVDRNEYVELGPR